MTRARVKALHDKVNSILSTLDTPSNGLLLHSETLCVIRYEPREEYARVAQHRTRKEKENNFSRRPPGPALLPSTSDTAGGDTPTLLVEAPPHWQPKHPGTTGLHRHCRPQHADTAARIARSHNSNTWPALPLGAPRHCRPHPR
jgi:hypothetical protein